jgi:hypothetical protein
VFRRGPQRTGYSPRLFEAQEDRKEGEVIDESETELEDRLDANAAEPELRDDELSFD